MTDTELNWLYQTAMSMDSIIEIGSFLGRSTHALLSGCPGIVISVDDFRCIPGWNVDAEKAFNLFRQNLSGFDGLRWAITDSLHAAEILPDADMVFIDGDHEYEAVKADISAWLPKTKRLICGHDYNEDSWPGVKQAVDEKFGNKVKAIDHIWYVEVGNG